MFKKNWTLIVLEKKRKELKKQRREKEIKLKN
jgi:hypothetical protein